MNQKTQNILQLIKQSVATNAPGATVILYGSYARGDYNEESDIDLLILVDKDRLTRDDENGITYPLFDIEIRTGMLISPLVYTRNSWMNHMVTRFYENVNSDGIRLLN